jgi:hypothetical protein
MQILVQDPHSGSLRQARRESVKAVMQISERGGACRNADLPCAQGMEERRAVHSFHHQVGLLGRVHLRYGCLANSSCLAITCPLNES